MIRVTWGWLIRRILSNKKYINYGLTGESNFHSFYVHFYSSQYRFFSLNFFPTFFMNKRNLILKENENVYLRIIYPNIFFWFDFYHFNLRLLVFSIILHSFSKIHLIVISIVLFKSTVEASQLHIVHRTQICSAFSSSSIKCQIF